jgi:ABC-type sugar transport system permease subunit
VSRSPAGPSSRRCTVPLVVVSLAFALLVNLGLPGRWLWRLSFFMPYIVTTDAGLMTLRVGLQTVKSAYGLQARQAT